MRVCGALRRAERSKLSFLLEGEVGGRMMGLSQRREKRESQLDCSHPHGGVHVRVTPGLQKASTGTKTGVAKRSHAIKSKKRAE